MVPVRYTGATSTRSARPSLTLPSSTAEELVAKVLARQGWTCLARNVRSVGSELDLVATKGKTLVFVEVKARRTWSGLAADAAALLSPRKCEALKRGARRFLATRPALQDFETVRFDLALVIHDPRGPRIEYHVGVIS